MFSLTVDNEPENAEIAICIVKGMKEIVCEFKTSNNTLIKQGEIYVCELTADTSANIPASNYAVEGRIVSPAGTTIQPLCELVILTDQIYKLD